VKEAKAPRQNSEGHPCPPWCETDHDVPASALSHWGRTASIELPAQRPDRISVRAVHLGATSDRAEVCVAAGELSLWLKPDDAKALAAIIDMPDDWDQVRELVAAIRRAAAGITDTNGAQP
jgi:hypothetical protein